MERKEWIYFYWGWNFDISFEICGYFDNRPRINFDIIFFSLTLVLPFRNKWTDECDPPKWGISIHGNRIWIYRGGKGNMNGGNKWWTFRFPWVYEWVRTSNLRKDGAWEHEKKGDNKMFWDEKWEDVIWNETHPYTYILKNGTVQNRLAKIKVEEREWRIFWLKFLPYPNKVRRDISVNFNDEVGERTGSWKGGTLGCGYLLKNDETPLECLRRMEKEQIFN